MRIAVTVLSLSVALRRSCRLRRIDQASRDQRANPSRSGRRLLERLTIGARGRRPKAPLVPLPCSPLQVGDAPELGRGEEPVRAGADQDAHHREPLRQHGPSDVHLQVSRTRSDSGAVGERTRAVACGRLLDALPSGELGGVELLRPPPSLFGEATLQSLARR